MNKDYKNYIDTIAMREEVFFKDGGKRMTNKAYYNKKMSTGTEYTFSYTDDLNNKLNEYSIYMQTSLYGGRLFKTHKEFVRKYGFHLQLKCPPSLYRQQMSKHNMLVPIKCNMSLTIPSLLEVYKSEEWEKYIVAKGTGNQVDDINGYIMDKINLKDLDIMIWGGKTYKQLEMDMKRDRSSIDTKYIKPMDMELSQMDFCVNTIDCDVTTIYNLLKYVGNYGTKNMKLYHNNIDRFDAEFTIGNYNDREQLVTKMGNTISTKANGLEFRRGSKSSQIVKFYDYTRKGMKYQYEHYMPFYVSNNDKKRVDDVQKYYGRTTKEISENKSTLRYEVSIRNIIGGNKGVKDLFVKKFNLEDKKITLGHLFDNKYSSVVRVVLKEYLYNIFGDKITENKIELGGKTMNKWSIIDKEGFSKGLQIMAILQLMEGDNGMSVAEIKKKFIEIGVSYESVRRIMNIIKDYDYSSGWNSERVIAMNLIKDIYEDLDMVN